MKIVGGLSRCNQRSRSGLEVGDVVVGAESSVGACAPQKIGQPDGLRGVGQSWIAIDIRNHSGQLKLELLNRPGVAGASATYDGDGRMPGANDCQARIVVVGNVRRGR